MSLAIAVLTTRVNRHPRAHDDPRTSKSAATSTRRHPRAVSQCEQLLSIESRLPGSGRSTGSSPSATVTQASRMTRSQQSDGGIHTAFDHLLRAPLRHRRLRRPGAMHLAFRCEVSNVVLQSSARLRLHLELPPLGLPFRAATARGRAGLHCPTVRGRVIHRVPAPVGPHISSWRGSRSKRCSGARYGHGAPPCCLRFSGHRDRYVRIAPDSRCVTQLMS